MLDGASFDDTVEAILMRMSNLMRHLQADTRAAAEAEGLPVSDYDTLHKLMVRDTPGQASPTDLALEAHVSPAGLTGRLDSLERAGLIRRVPDPKDRRRMGVEATDAGVDAWRRVMTRREATESRLLGTLSLAQRTQLAALLKQLTLHVEDDATPK